MPATAETGNPGGLGPHRGVPVAQPGGVEQLVAEGLAHTRSAWGHYSEIELKGVGKMHI